ncbi:MAG: GGDEF domain-containing protein [Planctomycetota bacterium]
MGIIQGVITLLVLFIVAAYGELDPLLLKACAALFLCAHILLWFGFWRLLVFMRMVNNDLAYRSFVDQLTGLFNFRYLERRMDEEQSRIDRHGGELAVLFMDLDSFKKVNDSKEAGGDTVTVSHEFVRTDTQQEWNTDDGSSTF